MADAGGAAAASTAQPASLATAGVELEAARLRRIKISDWIARNTAELARLKREKGARKGPYTGEPGRLKKKFDRELADLHACMQVASRG